VYANADVDVDVEASGSGSGCGDRGREVTLMMVGRRRKPL
jgi:hypothetical protein